MSELSRDDVGRIIRHFLLSAPPGELNDVLSDVRSLVADDGLLNDLCQEVFRTYNIEQLVAIKVPNQEHSTLLTKYAEKDVAHYLDPRSNQVLTVDHVHSKATSAVPADEPCANDPLRKPLEDAIVKYVTEHFPVGVGAVYRASASDDLVVCIAASKFSSSNCWSGRWRSVYRISPEGSSSAKLSGTMKLTVHYYEEGNVQLNTNHEHGEQVKPKNCSTPAQLVEGVVKAISKCEQNFQTQVDSMMNTMSDTTFKSMRRKLPVTGTLFDFTKAVGHALVKSMQDK
jgi:capping protein alpha